MVLYTSKDKKGTQYVRTKKDFAAQFEVVNNLTLNHQRQ